MNKTELVKRITRESKVIHSPLTQVRQVLDALFAALTKELSQPGGRVEIEHFGVLQSRLVKNSSLSRLTGKDGVTRTPPSQRMVITFRVAKGLRQSRN